MGAITLTKHYDSEQLQHDLRKLNKVYDFIKVQTIGYSVLGEPLLELVMGEGEKRVHWNGAFHANEWITTPLLLKVVEEYAEGIIHGRQLEMELFSSTRLSVVPMVNPDGVNLFMHGSEIAKGFKELVNRANHNHVNFTSWKANIRGVDLNNQFPAHWEVEKKRKPQEPNFRDYPGESSLSEPEAKALFDLTQNSNFDRVLAFHSQGEVIYWGYQNQEPSQAESVVGAFKAVSGYEPVHTIDSYAGYKDWFIQDYKREGYTVEVGKGINPLPWSTFYNHLKKVKSICFKSLDL
ncbi:M14 family metallopeptidase [Pontibacillus marinus]|uniref:Peptidase M14 n=1 Tax=Pontibacillus marinus BH030004 = DSM 16465 TaxID=1385511 RepID=A0A0A5G1T5_9BACI|nr:M14 family metallocarboxypeptidase [Pontibacillus marinus]KGX85015.1 peptidase M14 [Pontibacillus marinus BH030004 = DSM 16465]